MGKKRRKDKPRLIPEQDARICGTICLCQLTIVLSCVAIVYLSVAVYMPTYKAFQSGIEAEPVMCQTINTFFDKNYCPWVSCGEWCLTKTSGYCPQIKATSRRNGTDVELENCTRITTTSCPEVSSNIYKSKYNCNNGTECAALTGLFECSLGHCRNVSIHHLCQYHADGINIDAERDNMKLNGFFDCKKSKCVKLTKPPTMCFRYCPKVTTTAVNVLIMVDDSLVTAECDVGFAYNEARGNQPGVRLAQRKQIWNENDGILLTNCFDFTKDGDKLRATDCVNGTLLKDSILPKPFMNFTQFWKIYNESKTVVDSTDKFLPKQSSLIIHNSSQLFINLEGCVNTLSGECKDFLYTHGRDGENNTAQSRYPCYYNKDDSSKVLARFDLNKTWREFVFFFGVPSTLFVISFISLCIITRSVQVGDDAKMRCKCCTDDNSDIDDIDEIANKCVQQLNAIEEAVKEQEHADLPSTSKQYYHTERDHYAWSEPRATTSRAAYEEEDTSPAIAPPINLSPCTETTEKSSTSTNIELKPTEDKPLVIF